MSNVEGSRKNPFLVDRNLGKTPEQWCEQFQALVGRFQEESQRYPDKMVFFTYCGVLYYISVDNNGFLQGVFIDRGEQVGGEMYRGYARFLAAARSST